jgi:hypothetical protein
MAHQHKRIEGSFSQGWPVALFITALAVGSFVMAGVIHKRTFRSPNDVTAEYRKEGAGADHAPAAGEPKTAH